MKKWILKAVIQKGISFLPYKHSINYLFQKYITKGVQLTDKYMEDKLEMAKLHLDAIDIIKPGINFKTLEIGTGWYPVIPIVMYLKGAENIYTLDTSRLMTNANLLKTLQTFIQFKESGRLDKYLPDIHQDRWDNLIEQFNRSDSKGQYLNPNKFNIQYIIGDARDTGLRDHQIDVIISNNTFEHIPLKVLKPILKEFKRITKYDGGMSHFIDLSDHFAHLDKSITIYNFLRFSEKQWRLIDNPIQPQNRMRITQYRELYHELSIPITQENNRPGDMEALKKQQIHPEFNSIPEKELAVSHTHLISRF